MAAPTELFSIIGYKFRDPGLLTRALRHCSAGRDNNERLEFLGDAILGFVISEELYRRFPEAAEGDLSRIRAALVQKSTLAEIARELGMGDYLILGTGEMKSGGANRESILADALEALICAIYLDGGLEACRPKVLDWFVPRIEGIDVAAPHKDPKTRLQEYLQSIGESLPRYKVQEVSGKDHDQVFSVECEVALLETPVTGHGGNRREAEQQAAGNALNALGQ